MPGRAALAYAALAALAALAEPGCRPVTASYGRRRVHRTKLQAFGTGSDVGFGGCQGLGLVNHDACTHHAICLACNDMSRCSWYRLYRCSFFFVVSCSCLVCLLSLSLSFRREAGCNLENQRDHIPPKDFLAIRIGCKSDCPRPAVAGRDSAFLPATSPERPWKDRKRPIEKRGIGRNTKAQELDSVETRS